MYFLRLLILISIAVLAWWLLIEETEIFFEKIVFSDTPLTRPGLKESVK